MRGAVRWASLAAVAALVAGCASQAGMASSLARDAARTARQSSRVAIAVTMRSPGMSITITAGGAFDYARSTGYLRMAGPSGPFSQELFVPPHVYVKMPHNEGPAQWPREKSWMELSAADTGGLDSFFPGTPASDPSSILSSLETVASHVTQAGSATIRGVQTVHYRAVIDLAKALARPGQSPGAGVFLRALRGHAAPAQIWVDGSGLVRRVSLTPVFHGEPRHARVTYTVDFYDFGVAVHVSAPPPSEVVSPPQASAAFGEGSGPPPPPARGTLSPAQAGEAEQVVRAFWAGLGAGDLHAAAQAVAPAQRSCFLSQMRHFPPLKVSSLRVVSARPDGTGHATVLFEATIRLRTQGHTVPLPAGPGGERWLAATALGGAWHVDLRKSSPEFPFSGACQGSLSFAGG